VRTWFTLKCVRAKRPRMQEAYVELACPACETTWEEQPHDLPEPATTFECDACGETRYLAEFLRTQTGLEVVEEFHAGP
jgi:predicted RNA-binding Zn-ribbon protein involved in translation (DUF1610 family)